MTSSIRPTRRGALALGSTAALAALLAACGPSQNRSEDGSVASDGGTAATDDLLASITSSGTVRIGIEGTYKPYAYHDDSGTLVGFEKDIADAIASGLGATPQFIETEWDSLIAGLDVGKYDIVINNVGITEEREKKYLFSEPYAKVSGRVAVAKDSDIQTLADVKGRTAAQTATSNWAQAMTDLGAQILPVQGFAEGVELVVQERADAIGNDLVSFTTYLQEQPDANIRLLDEELPTDSVVGVIMPKGQEDLQAKIDEILDGMKSDGSLSAVYQQWVGTDLTPQG